jgi:hypothetical protein
MPPRTTPALLLPVAFAAALALGACKDPPLPPPDPDGKDLVPGVVVAAAATGEPTQGVRTYKIFRVYNLPAPMGHRLYMTAYDPKAPTFEDARRAWKAGGMTVAMDHVEVQLPVFLKRDHRVIAVEEVPVGDGGPVVAAGDGGK